jgi:hypothetical protein
MNNKLTISIPASPSTIELREIKKRQLDRKQDPSKKVTNEELYQMLFDILENQARQENRIKAIAEKLGIDRV